jgi:cytochrome c peroxidase
VAETLPAKLVRGKILFNNANDPRISHLGWISCGTCHLDGAVDGTTWITPDGPRQTQPLWNLDGTAPFHASATRDEVQDFEVDIEGLMDGIGLSAGKASAELGAPAGARSEDLDALAEFVLRGVRVPRAAATGGGRSLFAQAGCPTCHGGPHFTVSGLPGAPGTLAPNGEVEVMASLRDVGTRNPLDALGADGFDVPTLLGLHATAPYLHDGSAATVEEVLQNPAHTQVTLDPRQVAELAAFLRSIDDTTEPFP